MSDLDIYISIGTYTRGIFVLTLSNMQHSKISVAPFTNMG